MNSRTEFITHLVMAIMIMLVISVIAYYIGGNFIGDSIIDEAQTEIKLSEWKKDYFFLVRYMGTIAGFILVLWVVLTHWLLRPSDSTSQGKRWLWISLGIILATLCIILPYGYVVFLKNHFLIGGGMSLQLLFLICYCIVGYWGGSIFVTSNTYKYTPIFADFFRS